MTSERIEQQWRRKQEQAQRAAAPRETRRERTARERFEVEQEIPPELRTAWEKRGREFKGTPHQRWERFMEWAEQEPGELAEASFGEGPSDAELAAERERFEQETRPEKPPPPTFATAYDQFAPPEHRSRKMLAFVVATARRIVGKGIKVIPVHGETTQPRGWDYGSNCSYKIGARHFYVRIRVQKDPATCSATVSIGDDMVGSWRGSNVEDTIRAAIGEADFAMMGAAA